LADQEGGGNGTAPGGRAAAGPIVRRLVIVESPTKARKIAGYLGSNYIVESSRGHIRDLPRAAADVPAKYKSEPWARLGVNVDADFEPLYIISPEKKSTVTELKGLLKDVDELYLATDGDREGEAIAWHLLETLKPSVPVKRMVFHEITEPAILSAAENPRDLDIDLVDAQETRRILDRLYGYEVSPVLWKKVAPKLSAGRVQSVATRIIVQRERERMAFRSAGYWDVTAELDASVSDAQASPPKFTAKLNQVDGRRVAAGRDFDSLGGLKKPDEVLVLDEAAAGALATGLRGAHDPHHHVEGSFQAEPDHAVRLDTEGLQIDRQTGGLPMELLITQRLLTEHNGCLAGVECYLLDKEVMNALVLRVLHLGIVELEQELPFLPFRDDGVLMQQTISIFAEAFEQRRILFDEARDCRTRIDVRVVFDVHAEQCVFLEYLQPEIGIALLTDFWDVLYVEPRLSRHRRKTIVAYEILIGEIHLKHGVLR